MWIKGLNYKNVKGQRLEKKTELLSIELKSLQDRQSRGVSESYNKWAKFFIFISGKGFQCHSNSNHLQQLFVTREDVVIGVDRSRASRRSGDRSRSDRIVLPSAGGTAEFNKSVPRQRGISRDSLKFRFSKCE